MTTETVFVPREVLIGLCEYADMLLNDVNNLASYAGSTGAPSTHTDPDYLAAVTLLAQPVASEPVAWQWLNTAYFRRKIPAYANTCHWEPLYRHPPAPAIPEGYALVPIEPTEAMRDAGNIYILNRATLMRIWADMIAAAPQPTYGGTDR